MARDEGMGAGTVVMAFVLGAVAGAAAALLLAPAAGTDTRKALEQKVREGKERASEAARQGRELLNRQRDTIATAIERGKEAYKEARGREHS